jgi:hypothetical protein
MKYVENRTRPTPPPNPFSPPSPRDLSEREQEGSERETAELAKIIGSRKGGREGLLNSQ